METANNNLVTLVSDAIKGKEYAFKELYEQFCGLMFNISIRMTGEREEAEDVVQESFIKAFQNLQQLKDKKMFGAWLRKIVVNNCIHRTKNKMDFRELPMEYERPEDDDEDWVGMYSHAQLHHAIRSLPSGCRQIFLLYVSEDHPHKEIAALLNISESTSKSQYARAKKLLKEQLIKNG